MEIGAYVQILHYLRAEGRAIHPHELSIITGKSRVTIQSSLKRLIKNGWVEKIGESPKTTYKALELSLVPRETIIREGKKIEKASQSISNGLLEEFIRKSNNVARETL